MDLDNNFYQRGFYEFGKKIHTVAIASVLSFIPPIAPIAGIVALVFLFLALGDIKRINYQLKDHNLEIFYSKYIRSVVLLIVGVVFLVVGGVSLALSFLSPLVFLNSILFPISISVLVLGFIFLISSAVAEMKAWENLKIYFQDNREKFPAGIVQDVINGCDNLRTSALLYALGFLLITLFIGFIFQIVGYFKLAKLNSITVQYVPSEQQSATIAQIQPTENLQKSPNMIEISNFCPNCGMKLSHRGERYCPLCGSKLN